MGEAVNYIEQIQHAHQEPLPEARTPAVILDRALTDAYRRHEQPRGIVYEALLEAGQPATIAELIVLFVCCIAPAAILFLSGE